MAGGVVRGVGALLHGQPGVAVVELGGAVAAPVQMVREELGKLGSEIVSVVAGCRPQRTDSNDEDGIMPFEPAPRSRRSRTTLVKTPPPNGQMITADS